MATTWQTSGREDRPKQVFLLSLDYLGTQVATPQVRLANETETARPAGLWTHGKAGAQGQGQGQVGAQ